ncbi:thiamine-binding protein [Roseateles sp. P5_D6]
MAHPSFSHLRRFRLSFLSLSLLASGAAWAQQAQPAPQQAPSAASTPATTPATSRHMIAEIQVIPRPAGTADDRYKHVDAAIAVIQASGLHYEVHAMGTVVEGPPEKIWPLLQAVHEATLEAGAERTLSIIKVSGAAQAGGPRVDDLVRKFRK